ncbi:MAG: hypothetical protein DRH37_00120 [Deltaproteobacteria bacterium]|nr:MAG: hypothetical protein DRH37_00120 [Deltaproteobacteria bacterium]
MKRKNQKIKAGGPSILEGSINAEIHTPHLLRQATWRTRQGKGLREPSGGSAGYQFQVYLIQER